MAKLSSSILCTCGEHFVASYLSGMGLVVALTRAGTPTTDMIVTSEAGGRSISLQVKAGGDHNHVVYKRNPENNYWVWRAGKRAMDISGKFYWYAFVAVAGWPKVEVPPTVFFVPSTAVKRTLRNNDASQREWFWMAEEEAKQYRGLNGFRKLRKLIAR